MNWKRITVWLAVYARYASKYMKTEQTMFSPFLLVKDMHLFDTKEEMVPSRVHDAPSWFCIPDSPSFIFS